MERKTIDLDSRIVRHQEIISCDLEGETVMMSINNGEYYGMNALGSRIWALLEQPRTGSEILKILIDKYDVSPEHCRKSVLEFLGKLKELNLIKEVSQ